ncbi:hypothetical protein L21_0113 [Methanoculleus chikugoensis]|uniref:Uncharacterized protein n=1 Tax=Methanoculleus chikugoensis TaxID=118126 RepID=A0A1M4MH86_9EURY|nr:hypothetical protein [Methanoculleus chikugoensis]SCL74245.1 hypothetical protein L21_0113 [Methanoculleus chikugoensis]
MNILICPGVKPIFSPFRARLFPGEELDFKSVEVTEMNEKAVQKGELEGIAAYKEAVLKGDFGKITGYFSLHDWGVIVFFAIVAFATSSYGLRYILPGGTAPSFVHGFLKLPGPGAGIFISSAFICVWLVLAILLVKKPGTVLCVTFLMVILSTAASLITGGNVRFDYLPFLVAIIIEGAGLLSLEKKPYRYIFPSFLTIMGLITLALMLTGNAKMGESGAAATVFPLGYAVSGIFALGLAVIFFSYPSVKFIIGAGCAEMFNIVFRWATHGKTGLFTWVPVPLAIPPLLTFAFVCGAVMAFLAYCVYILFQTYRGEGPLARFNQ